MKTTIALKLVILLIGIAIMFLGLNIGLGGIRTLGWQIPQNFLNVTDALTFQTQDNHIRFIGGVWFGIGMIFALSTLALAKLRPTLISLCAIIAVAGLFRFSILDTDVIFSAAILPSLVFELLGFPLLAIWLYRSKL